MKNGILLHISSLPSKYGIGSFGKSAYDFVDFLVKSKVDIWQILPHGPTSYGDSPYQATSSFAINPYFIDLDILVEQELIKKEDLILHEYPRVDYGFLYNTRYEILHKAFLNRKLVEKEFNEFINAESSWLDDYALFMTLHKIHAKDNLNGLANFYDDFKFRKPESLAWAKNEFKDLYLEYQFYQYLAYTQWFKLKKYANDKGIKIMGDLPIYCAYDSEEVWAHKECFLLDNKFNPTFVAGCPPDGFTPDGQLWGNPIYDYDYLKKHNYSFLVNRMKHALRLYDILRLDHFRGYAGYYEIPYGDKTAKNGHWEKGVGLDFFKALEKEVGKREIIAENLGFLTDDVTKLMKDTKYPGMHIFQFELGFDNVCPIKKKNPFNKNNVIYTGTHDNMTLMSFYNTLGKREKDIIDKLCNISFYDKPNLKIIEFIFNLKLDYTIIPLQDYLGLDDECGRMNMPSKIGGNWSYMSREYDYSDSLSDFIKKVNGNL